MLTLVIEFGRQRRKFDLKHPIDIGLLENQIKSTFGIEDKNNSEYLIQIYDEFVKNYLDLTSESFLSTNNNNNIIKGQIISSQINSFQFQPKVTKQQVVGLITLESIQESLQQWSQLLQHIQLEISKEIQTVKETINAVKSHYELIDELNSNPNSPIYPLTSTCSSPSSVSQCVNKTLTLTPPPPPVVPPTFSSNSNNSHLIRPINNIDRKDSYYPYNGTSSNQQRYRPNNNNNNNRRGTYNNTKILTNRENNSYYPPSQIPSRPIEYNVPVTITYQRFQTGVDFEGELSKYYNPTYFFLRISNQTESYDEMHKNINFYYNNMDMNKCYIPQPSEFCAAKSPNDSNWYRARIIRIIENDKVQLIFIDNGEINELNLNLIQPLNSQFSDRPAQALACSLAQVLPFTQNDKCGWNRRACMSLENSLKYERISSEKLLLKVTVSDMNQVKWPIMFIHISTPTISSLTDHMCDLYLSRRCTNLQISEYWSKKIRPEQYVLFNLSSLINQKQYFILNNNQSSLSFNQTIDLVMTDLEFFSRQ
ncbi:unnamed protein product [Adineta steineri]|uniref:Tudor domain-containing protein n=1 Tax=Adineta steineri TaxID=433720 RepID=A0A814VFZ8_9BILA|nr:unnamed protein product [Adineta steineri]CAF3895467.1 unnamed protein product [Adineta steineri]